METCAVKNRSGSRPLVPPAADQRCSTSPEGPSSTWLGGAGSSTAGVPGGSSNCASRSCRLVTAVWWNEVDVSELRAMRTVGAGPDFHDVGRRLIRYVRERQHLRRRRRSDNQWRFKAATRPIVADQEPPPDGLSQPSPGPEAPVRCCAWFGVERLHSWRFSLSLWRVVRLRRQQQTLISVIAMLPGSPQDLHRVTWNGYDATCKR